MRNGLQLTGNGAPLLGKKVTFTPDATEATKATLRLEGEFDLSGILKGQRPEHDFSDLSRCISG